MTIEEALTVLDSVLGQMTLNDVQELVFRHAWEDWTYEQIAEQFGYTTDYVRNVGSHLWSALSELLGVRIGKKNLQSAVRRWAQQHDRLPPPISEVAAQHVHLDLNEAPDIGRFIGRSEALETLSHWIEADRCRFVAVLGMGGMGKTALAAKLVHQITARFDAVIWRSLRNAPPIDELLSSLIQFLSSRHTANVELALDRGGKIQQLLEQLRQQRCLIILDNAESVLPCHASPIEAEHWGYIELLNALSDFAHQSCIVLTSREKPDVIAWKEGVTLPVRSLQLEGLQLEEVKALFAAKATFVGTEADWQRLVQHYAGNVLALKMVAAAIEDLFSSNISDFLHILGTLIFDDIRDLLDHQFERLSTVEQEIMFWLAINREVTSFTELRDDLLCPMSRQALPGVLRSLKHRFLIDTTPHGFTQQPVVMEYVTNRLIEQVSREIGQRAEDRGQQEQEGNLLFQTHALYKATAKDYIRDSQARLILAPLVERLLAVLRSPQRLEEHCRSLLAELWFMPAALPGYEAGNLINLLHYLGADLTGLELSNLTIRQAQFQETDLHAVNLEKATLIQSVFLESLGAVWSVAFSPDGALLAASDVAGCIHVWRVADHQKVMTCQGHHNWVCTIAFSPDSKQLASGSADHQVKLWDVATGQCVQTFHGHTEWVLAVTFSVNGVLASSSADRTIKLWNAETGEGLQSFTAHTNWVGAIAFSPDGQYLVSGSDDTTLKVWEVKTVTCLQTLTGHTSPLRSVAFSPDGQQIASSGSDRTIRLWDVASGLCLRTLTEQPKPVRSLAYLPMTKTNALANHLVTGTEDGCLRVWDSQTGECLRVLSGHTGHVRSIAVHPTGQLIASGSADQTVKLWHATTGDCVRTLRGYTNFVLSVACTSNYSAALESAPLLASGCSDRSVRLWNLHTGECLQTLKGHTNDVWGVVFMPPSTAPGQRLLASCSTDQTIRLWDGATGACLQVLKGHSDWIHAIASSPDGTTLASASSDQTVRLWDVQTGKCLRTIQAHASHIWSVAFSPVGNLFASSSDDQTVKLWDAHTGKCIQILNGHTRLVQAVAFSPDGNWLASASSDQTIALWDVQTGRCLRTLTNEADHVRAIAFSPLQSPFVQHSGQLLLCSYAGNIVKVWNAHTGELLHQLAGHSSRIWSVAFSPDGLTLISGSEDGTMRLWDVELGKCLNTLQIPRPYEGMILTGVQGLTEAQKSALKALGAVD
jgi:WD40 repeat protein